MTEINKENPVIVTWTVIERHRGMQSSRTRVACSIVARASAHILCTVSAWYAFSRTSWTCTQAFFSTSFCNNCSCLAYFCQKTQSPVDTIMHRPNVAQMFRAIKGLLMPMLKPTTSVTRTLESCPNSCCSGTISSPDTACLLCPARLWTYPVRERHRQHC
jgi:hypothetical protein